MAFQILEQIPLAPLTTMRVGGRARFFARVESTDELSEAIIFAKNRNLPVFILGAGSNTLFHDDGFEGLVIQMSIEGIACEGNHVTSGAGVMWDDLVRETVAYNLWGVENLSLIPGSVGGAVVQNIGAYGIEVCEAIFSVDVFDRESMQMKTFLRDECAFGYRESIFKKNNNLIVLRVTFAFSQDGVPNVEYEDVKKYFEERVVLGKPTLIEIREAIIAIRIVKMPEWGVGSAGSFFKNPVVSVEDYEQIKKRYPGLKAYSQTDGAMKLSAAWLLDHVGGWRGVRRGDAGVHEKQSLILVNYGTATEKEILLLANEMKKDIKDKVEVTLEEEVKIFS